MPSEDGAKENEIMGMAEDFRLMVKEIQEAIAAFPSDPKVPINREESEKVKTKLGQLATKLDGMANQIAAPPVVLPADATDPKTRPGGSHGVR